MKLADYLTKVGLTHADFAEEIGVSRSAVTQWINGITVPSGERMALVHRLTGGRVGLEDWFDQKGEKKAKP